MTSIRRTQRTTTGYNLDRTDMELTMAHQASSMLAETPARDTEWLVQVSDDPDPDFPEFADQTVEDELAGDVGDQRLEGFGMDSTEGAAGTEGTVALEGLLEAQP